MLYVVPRFIQDEKLILYNETSLNRLNRNDH
jgi:hypothetical protein